MRWPNSWPPTPTAPPPSPPQPTQYAVRDGVIVKFWPETVDFETVAPDLESSAQWLYSDYQVETGYPFAEAWRRDHGPLAPGQRLGPKIPFSLGGEYTLDNLYAATDQELMSFRAYLCSQIEDLPDGAQIELRITD